MNVLYDHQDKELKQENSQGLLKMINGGQVYPYQNLDTLELPLQIEDYLAIRGRYFADGGVGFDVRIDDPSGRGAFFSSYYKY